MRIIALITAILFATYPANATPPQIVGVSETLLGVNDTHLFVLRRIDDNMGSHYPTQTDVVLIARNRKTNSDDQIWPVMRMIDHGVDFAEFGFETQVEPLPLKDRVNPFDILLWRKARPFMAPSREQADYGFFLMARKNEGTMITVDDQSYQLKNRPAVGLIMRSLNQTRAALPSYFTEGDDMLKDIEFDITQDCYYTGYTKVFDRAGGEYEKHWAAMINCENDETMAPISMFLMIPQVK